MEREGIETAAVLRGQLVQESIVRPRARQSLLPMAIPNPDLRASQPPLNSCSIRFWTSASFQSIAPWTRYSTRPALFVM